MNTKAQQEQQSEEQQQEEQQNQEPTFEERVSDIASKMVQNDKGVWEIPKEVAADLDEATAFAVKAEKRFRDTQSQYTKSRQKLKELETVNDKLTSHLIDNVTMHLTDDQRSELDELKMRDPDGWREKLNEYETQSQEALQKALDKYRQEGKELSEVEVRKAQMEAFTESTGIELNDDVIENELPAKLSKDLEKGTITFDEFLEKAQKFLTTDKVIKGADDEPTNTPNMSKMGGGSVPSERAQIGDIVTSYEKEIY